MRSRTWRQVRGADTECGPLAIGAYDQTCAGRPLGPARQEAAVIEAAGRVAAGLLGTAPRF